MKLTRLYPTFSSLAFLLVMPAAHADFDPDAQEFFTRAQAAGDLVTEAAKIRLNHLVITSKQIGLWKQMVLVPCLEGSGAMHPLGGAPQRTDAKFIRQGTTTLTPQGVKFVPGSGFANHVETPFNYQLADEPVFIGVVGNTEGGALFYSGHTWLRWGSAQPLLYTFVGANDYGGYPIGFGTPGSHSAEFRMDNQELRTIRDRPHFSGAQFGGSAHTLNACLNAQFQALTNNTVTSGRPGFGRVWFLQPAPENITHVVQACVLFYGPVQNLPIARVWPMLATTLLAENRPPYLFYQIAGQSNSRNELLWEITNNHGSSPTQSLFHTNNNANQGARIARWVGSDPALPVRSGEYQTALQAIRNAMPPTSLDRWKGIYIWFQGESDAETYPLSLIYGQQLKNQLNFIRADTRPDLRIAVALIDADIYTRTRPIWGDFQLTECTGAAVGANGAWSIVPRSGIAESFTDYQFNHGDWTLRRIAGHWELAQNGNVHYTSVQDAAHPGLIQQWTPGPNATGSPKIGESRTLEMEMLRQAERDYVAQDPLSFLFDTRGCQRVGDVNPGFDFVHLTTTGHTQAATRFAAAYALAFP